MKYRKGQLVKFKKWVGITPRLLDYKIRDSRRDVRVNLTQSPPSLGIVLEAIPVAKAWRKEAFNRKPKNCYIVWWQKENKKKLMYESEISKSD